MSNPPSQTLLDLSNQLARAVERGAESIVAVHARPQLPSTGVHWRDGLVVTTNGTVRRDQDIAVRRLAHKRLGELYEERGEREKAGITILVSSNSGRTAIPSSGRQ